VVLPAPFGPMSPTIRPSSICKSTPSRATVSPNVLRKPRASMHCKRSALPLPPLRFGGFPLRSAQELVHAEAEPLNAGVDPRPLLVEKPFPFGLDQRIACSLVDEHAPASPRLHQAFVGQVLVSLENRERIDPVFGGHGAHRRNGIAFLQHSVENH